MRAIVRGAALAAVLALAALAAFAVPTIWGRPWSIDHFYTRVFLRFAVARPMLLSQLRVLEPWGIDWHQDDLDDFSNAFLREQAELVRSELRILRSYDFEDQTPAQQLSTRVLEWFLQVTADGEPFLLHDYPLNQFDGVQSELPDFMLNVHPVHDRKSAEDYVARLAKFGTALDQVQEAVRERAALGLVPPRLVVARVEEQVARFLAEPPDTHPLVTGFAAKLAALETLSDGERAALRAAARDEVARTVLPAYQRLASFLPELAARAPDAVGVWALPEGSLYYGWALRYHTTTDLDAEAIHALGLAEVARIHEEMRAILAAEGVGVGFDAPLASESVGAAGETWRDAPPAQGGAEAAATPPAPAAASEEPPGAGDAPAPGARTLGDLLRALHREERFRYPDTDAGREAILADYREIVAGARARLPELVGRLPEAPVVVERVPPFKEAGAAGAYYQPPPLDGSRPGIFYVNLRAPGDVASFGMRTLAYHEALPGHHLQIALALENPEVPLFRRVLPFTAYVEGWALYAETLAAEQGWHPTPWDRLGQLVAEVFRAARLVVDTGIHARRWTREQAIEYMLANTGMPESDVVAEVERYIVMPGQACAYKVGQLRLLALRERARRALGPRFDLRAFHDRVLGDGALPLEILEARVDAWIAAQSGR